jgi:hypothetical protein
VLVKDSAVVELKLARKTALFQEFQSSIYGCESDRRVPGLYYRVEVFARDMAFGVQEHIEDQLALVGALEPLPFEVLVKDLFFFALHIAPEGTAEIIHAELGG